MLPCHCQVDTGLVPQGASVVTSVGRLLVASGVGGSLSLCSPHHYHGGVASFLLVMKKVLTFCELFPDTSAMGWGRGALFLPRGCGNPGSLHCLHPTVKCEEGLLPCGGEESPSSFFWLLGHHLSGGLGVPVTATQVASLGSPQPLLLWVQVGTSFPGVPVEWSLSKPIVSLRCHSPGPFARRVTCGGVLSTSGVCGFLALQLHVWDG